MFALFWVYVPFKFIFMCLFVYWYIYKQNDKQQLKVSLNNGKKKFLKAISEMRRTQCGFKSKTVYPALKMLNHVSST